MAQQIVYPTKDNAFKKQSYFVTASASTLEKHADSFQFNFSWKKVPGSSTSSSSLTSSTFTSQTSEGMETFSNFSSSSTKAHICLDDHFPSQLQQNYFPHLQLMWLHPARFSTSLLQCGHFLQLQLFFKSSMIFLSSQKPSCLKLRQFKQNFFLHSLHRPTVLLCSLTMMTPFSQVSSGQRTQSSLLSTIFRNLITWYFCFQLGVRLCIKALSKSTEPRHSFSGQLISLKSLSCCSMYQTRHFQQQLCQHVQIFPIWNYSTFSKHREHSTLAHCMFNFYFFIPKQLNLNL